MDSVTLLPADIYQVINKSLLSDNDKLVLNMLYMPIIGLKAVTLYNTLYDELKLNSFISKEASHHHLIISLEENIENIKKARTTLEGVGLLKTYVKEGSVNSYVYELYSPISVDEFFKNPVFSTTLLCAVGHTEYKRLKNYFCLPKIDLNSYKEITSPFDMTFKCDVYEEVNDNENVITKEKLPLTFLMEFDFDTLISSMPKGLFNKNALTKSNKELIRDLSFLYKMDPITMSDMVKISLNEKGLIDKEELKKNTRKYYLYNHNNKLPRLLYKTQPDNLKSNKSTSSQKNRMIKVFETTTPIDFLKSKYKGVTPTSKDMQILEMLLVDLHLTPAVCNVLIDYVLKTQNNKLVKSYVEVIAGQWCRENLTTAKEAMEYAEKSIKKPKTKNVLKEAKTEEKIPEWFNKTSEKENMSEGAVEEFKEFLSELVWKK